MYRKGDALRTWLLEEARKVYNGYGATASGSMNLANAVVQSQRMELWQYAMGLEALTRTKPNPKTGPNDPDMEVVGTSRNTKFLNHLLNTMVGTLCKEELEPNVERIDSFAHEYHEDYRALVRLATLLNNIDKKATEAAQVIGLNPDEIPTNTSQLRARLSTNPQMMDERNAKVAIQSIFLNNQMPAHIRQFALSLVIWGFGGLRHDNSGRRKEIRCMNPIMTIHSWSGRDDLEDITYFAEIILVPLSKLKAEAAGQIEDWTAVEASCITYQQLLELQGFAGVLGQYGSEFEGDKFAQVLDFEFKYTHMICFKKKPRPGNVTQWYVKIDESGEDGKVAEKPFQRRYGIKMLLNMGQNTECYNWGHIAPESRPPMPLHENDEALVDYSETHLGAVFYRPMSMNGVNSGPVDKAMGSIDSLNMLINKRNNVIAAITPPIITYDIDAFQEVILKPGAKAVDIKKIVQQMVRFGRVPYRGRARKNMPNVGQNWPINLIPNDVSQQLKGIESAILFEINFLRNLIGIPETLDGIIPGTRTGKGVFDNANTAATNSLDPLFAGIRSVYERSCRYWCYIIQWEDASYGYGGKSVRIESQKYKWNIYNISCSIKPTAEAWAILMDAAIKGHEKGTIPFSMIMYLQRESDLMTAEMVYADFEDRMLAKQQANEEKNIQMNDQLSKNTAKEASDLKISQIQAQGEMVLQKVIAEGQEERKALSAKIMADQELTQQNFHNTIKELMEENRLAMQQMMLEHRNTLDEIKATPKPVQAAA